MGPRLPCFIFLRLGAGKHRLFSTFLSLVALVLLAANNASGNEHSIDGSGTSIASVIGEHRQVLETPKDLDALLDRLSNSRFVLLGESTHGTEEFYHWRSVISKRLITEKGFSFIAVEGDAAPFFEVNAAIKYGQPDTPIPALLRRVFTRWPQWMWANTEIVSLIKWLYGHNRDKVLNDRVGIYGFDVYAPEESKKQVRLFLESIDDKQSQRVLSHYRCFAPYRENFQLYTQSYQQSGKDCSTKARKVFDFLDSLASKASNTETANQAFVAAQHALVVKNAEKHFRAMAAPELDSWNMRAEHFAQAVVRLAEHYGPDSRAILWAHNTHIGDARATDMARRGQVNIGQRLRERFGENQVALVGFGTYEGTVLAGRRWGANVQVLPVPKGAPGSLEAAVGKISDRAWYVILDERLNHPLLHSPIPHRAIGVVYNPEYERHGNYVQTILARRYDAFIFIPRTRALTPLGR